MFRNSKIYIKTYNYIENSLYTKDLYNNLNYYGTIPNSQNKYIIFENNSNNGYIISSDEILYNFIYKINKYNNIYIYCNDSRLSSD